MVSVYTRGCWIHVVKLFERCSPQHAAHAGAATLLTIIRHGLIIQIIQKKMNCVFEKLRITHFGNWLPFMLLLTHCMEKFLVSGQN